jgi:hypothetical protein
MIKKLRKTYGDVNAPCTVALMRLIETQSKTTVANWTLDYAELKMLPLFAKHCPDDERPAHTIAAAREWLDGKVKLPYVKNIILNTFAFVPVRDQVAQSFAVRPCRSCFAVPLCFPCKFKQLIRQLAAV